MMLLIEFWGLLVASGLLTYAAPAKTNTWILKKRCGVAGNLAGGLDPLVGLDVSLVQLSKNLITALVRSLKSMIAAYYGVTRTTPLNFNNYAGKITEEHVVTEAEYVTYPLPRVPRYSHFPLYGG